MRIFIIEGFLDVGGGGLVVFIVFAEGFVVGDSGVERFAGGKGGFEFCALFGGFGVAEGESSTIEVVSPLASLSSLLRGSARAEYGMVVLWRILGKGHVRGKTAYYHLVHCNQLVLNLLETRGRRGTVVIQWCDEFTQ